MARFHFSVLRLNNIPLYTYVAVIKLCPTLLDPMNCSMSGFPVPHHLVEFAQVHVTELSMEFSQYISCPWVSEQRLAACSTRVSWPDTPLHFRWLGTWRESLSRFCMWFWALSARLPATPAEASWGLKQQCFGRAVSVLSLHSLPSPTLRQNF